MNDYHRLGRERRGYPDHPSVYGVVASLTYFTMASYLNVMRNSWRRRLQAGGVTPLPVTYVADHNDPKSKQFVKVGPDDFWSKLVTSFGTLEVEVEGDPEVENPWERPGGLCVVLGAGNFDAPVEAISALFCDNHVCVYKPSPMLRDVVKLWERILAPFISENYLAFSPDDSPQAASCLLQHPRVTKWGMTGAKATAERLLTEVAGLRSKPCTVELGGCSPYIVVPGAWTTWDIQAHADYYISGHVANGGHICAHPQTVITCKNWKQRTEFLDAIEEGLAKLPFVGTFYPNEKERCREVLTILENDGRTVDRVDAGGKTIIFQKGCDTDSKFLGHEAFGPYAVEVALDVPEAEFLDAATKFANEKCFGTLAATIIIKNAGCRKHELNRGLRPIDRMYGV
eukprot:Polyplicarium_translucidae@DN3390_c0_g2_i5.p1